MCETEILENELPKALELIDANWIKQNSEYDKKSNFIYNTNTLSEVINKAKENNVPVDYAIHRWYNFHTSITCEKIFTEYGAIKEQNLKNKEIDIYIDGIPYDVKLTVYPKKLSYYRPFDLNTRYGKDGMARWMYKNQSQENRKHLKNRLFIVCDGKNAFDNLKLKSNFNIIRKQIEDFMENRVNGLNKITITDENNKFIVYSDIIYIKES